MDLPVSLSLLLTGIVLFLAGLACGLLFNMAKKPKGNISLRKQSVVKSNLITYPVTDTENITVYHFLNRHDKDFPTNNSTAVAQLVVLNEDGQPLEKLYPFISGSGYGDPDHDSIETKNHIVKWNKPLGLVSVSRRDGHPVSIELGAVVATYI